MNKPRIWKYFAREKWCAEYLGVRAEGVSPAKAFEMLMMTLETIGFQPVSVGRGK